MIGNIVFTQVLNQPTVPIDGANNGLSYNASTDNFVLGQDVGDTGNPAFLLSSREIPYTAGTTLRLTNLLFASTNILMGGQLGGRISLGINGRAGAVPTLLLNNDTNTTYKQWFFESSPQIDAAGMLQLIDQTGLFFIMNRQLASISAPFQMYQRVLNKTVSGGLALNADRSRAVITNQGAAGNIVITLPTIVATTIQWPEYTFTDVSGLTITIAAPGGVTIRVGAVVSPAGGTVTNTAIGDSVRLQYLGNNNWQAISVVGNWVTP